MAEVFKNCEDEAETQTLHVLISKASAARRVLGPISLHGYSSLKAVDAYDKEVNWLHQQEPAVDNPLPACVKAKVFHTRASNAWPSTIFWQTLRSSDMSKMMDEDSIEPLQLKLFPGKILSITQDEKPTAAMSNLSSLASSFTQAVKKGYFPDSANLIAEVGRLKMVMSATQWLFYGQDDGGSGQAGVDWNAESLERFLFTASEVRTALEVLPRGRELLASAQTALTQCVARTDSVSRWKGAVEALGTFSDFGFQARFLDFKKAVEDAIISTEVLEEVVTITLLRRLCKDAITHVQQFAKRDTLLTCHM